MSEGVSEGDSSFTAGDVWRVCVPLPLPLPHSLTPSLPLRVTPDDPGPLTPTLTTTLTATATATAVKVTTTTHNNIHDTTTTTTTTNTESNLESNLASNLDSTATTTTTATATATARVATSSSSIINKGNTNFNFLANIENVSPYSRSLEEADSVNLTIYVNEIFDSVANSGTCGVSSSMGCNIRSALSLCMQNLVTPESNCTIVLPPKEMFVLDVTLGELTIVNGQGTLIINGQGSEFTPNATTLGSMNNIRFMNVSVGNSMGSPISTPQDSISPFHFHLLNITLDGFGYVDFPGGSLFLQNIAGGSLQDVACHNSRGSYGAAVYMDNSMNFEFLRSQFIDGIAAGDFT